MEVKDKITKLVALCNMVAVAGAPGHLSAAIFGREQPRQSMLPGLMGSVGLRSNRAGEPAAAFWVHPAVLDSCLHVGAYLGSAEAGTVKVPAGLDAFAVHQHLGELDRCADQSPPRDLSLCMHTYKRPESVHAHIEET